MATYDTLFNHLMKMIDFPDMDKKFICVLKSDDDFESDYNLYNPSSKATFLTLFLYSVEPPFYFHLNQACRSLDVSLVTMLGPFA